MNRVDWLLQTVGGVVGLILRLTLAVVIFPHGAQKLLGWFGGHSFMGTLKYFTDSGIPADFAVLAIAAEFFGLPWPGSGTADARCPPSALRASCLWPSSQYIGRTASS